MSLFENNSRRHLIALRLILYFFLILLAWLHCWFTAGEGFLASVEDMVLLSLVPSVFRVILFASLHSYSLWANGLSGLSFGDVQCIVLLVLICYVDTRFLVLFAVMFASSYNEVLS